MKHVKADLSDGKAAGTGGGSLSSLLSELLSPNSPGVYCAM